MTETEADPVRVAEKIARVMASPVRIRCGESLVCAAGLDDEPFQCAGSFSWECNGQRMTVEIGASTRPITGETIDALAGLVSPRISPPAAGADILRDRFVHDLLSGAAGATGRGPRIAQILGLQLDRPRSVILVDAAEYIADDSEPDGGTRRPRAAQRVIGHIVRFFRLPNEAICAHIGEGQIAILKASASRDLPDWAQSGDAANSDGWGNLHALKRAANGLHAELRREFGIAMDIAVGRYHPGIAGLAASYDDCQVALRLGRARNPGSVHCLSDLGLAALVATAPTPLQRGLAARLVAPLEREPGLSHTLRTFFDEDCSIVQTAERLVVHRNTLMYRLDRIARLSGLNPRKFNDAVQLKAALEVCTDSPVQSHN